MWGFVTARSVGRRIYIWEEKNDQEKETVNLRAREVNEGILAGSWAIDTQVCPQRGSTNTAERTQSNYITRAGKYKLALNAQI
jgi:hypothetical protein